MKDSKATAKLQEKKRLSLAIPQTKAKRTNKLFKQTGSVTLFFDSNTLREYFVKNALKSKKDFVSYLAQDKIMCEMIDLVLVKDVTPQSAEYCHYTAKILAGTSSPHLLSFIYASDGKYLDQLFQVLRPDFPTPHEKLEKGKEYQMSEWDLPDYMYYFSTVCCNLIAKKPKDAEDFFQSRKDSLLPTIQSHFDSPNVASIVACLCKTEVCAAKPPAWLRDFLVSLPPQLKQNPELAMSMARLTTSLPPSPILDIVVGSLTENIGVLFSLMKRGETASDAYYLWECCCNFWKDKKIMDKKHDAIQQYDSVLANILRGKSALGAQVALKIIDEAWVETNYVAVKACMKALIEPYFTYPTRNMFHCGATRLLTDILCSKSVHVEKLQMKELLLDDIDLVGQINNALQNNNVEFTRHNLGKLLNAIPQPSAEVAKLARLLLQLPTMDSIWDLPPKLQKLREKMSLDLSKVDDVGIMEGEGATSGTPPESR